MKPETIERRRLERLAQEAQDRELFLQTYTDAQSKYPLPAEIPATGSRYSDFLPDGRCVIISADRITVF